MARKSPTPTRRSTTCSPRASVAPMTWPVRMPPPANSIELAGGQWSRPGCDAAAAAVGRGRDARRAAELAGDHDQHPAVEPALVDVFDQRRDGLVESGGPEFMASKTWWFTAWSSQLCHAAAQGAVERRGHQLDARLDQPPGQQALLPPGVCGRSDRGPAGLPATGRRLAGPALVSMFQACCSKASRACMLPCWSSRRRGGRTACAADPLAEPVGRVARARPMLGT